MKLRSLRTRFVLIFMSITCLVGISFLFMNVLFWQRVNEKRNEKELLEVYSTLKEMVADEETTTDDLVSYVSTMKNDLNVTFALQGEGDWEFMVFTFQTVSTRDREFLLDRLQENLLTEDDDSVDVLEETDEYTLQKATIGEVGDFLECYGYMTNSDGESRKFILSMPLEAIRATSAYSNRFYIIITLVTMLLGGVIIWFVTRRITKPILNLADISKRMSRLDFSARFTGNERDEVGVLGNNMNEMASQLERTILQLQMSNEQLQKEIEEKNHVDDMRRDFISNVSHELKTPIALIQGYAEGLQDMADDPEERAYYCDVIRDEADKMARMVKKLTTLNQLEFGTDGMDMQPFDIIEMIRDLVKNSKKMQEEHQATVTCSLPESCMVMGDCFKIEEVLNNYYSNAYNHLKPPGNISFTFDDLGPGIRISVHNTGDNIPEEDLDKVWIKFYKVDKARTRAYGGSGIGLSIVKAIMDAHGHEYGVYNTSDGVTFWFELSKAEMPEEVNTPKEEN